MSIFSFKFFSYIQIGLKYNKYESKWIWNATGKEIPTLMSHWKCLSYENDYALSSIDNKSIDQLECALVNKKYTIEAIECNTLTKNTNFICQKRDNFTTEESDRIEIINDCVSNNDCTLPRKCVENKCVCPSNNHYWSIMADGQNECVECPKGWILFNDKCYLISSDQEKLTWNNALEYCVNKSSILITIDFDNTFPKELFRVIKGVSSAQKFWIGGYKNSTTNSFVRLDGKSIISTNSW
jgi:hypothetical protein